MGLSLLILVLTFALMWVLLVVPRQRQERARRAVVESVQVGERVITSTGIYATITALAGDTAQVEIAPGVVVTIARSAIHRRLGAGAVGGQVL